MSQIIARLVAACRPFVRFSELITYTQLQQLVRLTVWKDQQQPWTVHAITCLLQDIVEADKQYNLVNYPTAGYDAAGTSTDGADASGGWPTDDQMNIGDASPSAAAGSRAQYQLPTNCEPLRAAHSGSTMY